MKLSQIKPTESLKALLQESGIKYDIYAFGERVTDLKKEPFIEILYNGDIQRKTIQQGLFSSTLFLSINVPLMARDIVNKNKESMILSTVENTIGQACSVEVTGKKEIILTYAGQEIIYNGSYLTFGANDENIKFTYSLLPSATVVNSRNIVAGFSTFGINIKCLIYKI